MDLVIEILVRKAIEIAKRKKKEDKR